MGDTRANGAHPDERRSWGDPREGPGARPESPPPTAVPVPLHRPAFLAGAGHRPTPETAAAPAPPTRTRARRQRTGNGGPPGRAGRLTRASGGGEGRAAGRLLPQPRREPSPASHPSPTDPALRANPYPEVTDLICRLPLHAFF